VGKKKPDKVGKIECALCHDYYWYINASHLRTTHSLEFDDYAQEVAEKNGVDGDEPPFTGDTLHSANKWQNFDGEVGLDIAIKKQ
jgi:hypothetical protein